MARTRVVETKRELIIESALRLILRKGYDGTTVDDVAAAAGVSKGLVSYHFAKKDALFKAVLEKILAKLESDLEEMSRQDLPARERLRLNFRNLFENAERTRSYYTVLVDFLAQAPREALVRSYTQTIYQTILRSVEATIRDGIAAGEFRQVDPRMAASTVVALTEGFVFQWLYNPEGIDLGEAYEVSDQLLAEFLVIGPPPGL